jgi:hypothetical protein
VSLNLLDCVKGTVVDHYKEIPMDKEGRVIGKERPRDEIRRGIIVKVSGNDKDAVDGIWVKFSIGGEAEKIPGAELARVYKASSRIAKEAYRRVMGLPKMIGKVFSSRKNPVARRVVDEMDVTAPAEHGMVKPPEEDEESIGGMDLADEGA